QVVALGPGVSGLQGVGLAALDDLPAVEVLHQRVQVTALEVDNAQLDGLVRRDVDTLPDGFLDPIGVVVVEGGQGARIGGRVVLGFLAGGACRGRRTGSAR